jgi:hypothetical protein
MKRNSFCTGALVFLLLAQQMLTLAYCFPVLAEQTGDDTDRETAKYDDILETNTAPSGSLMAEAEAAVRARRFDRAIELSRRAIAKDSDDLDLHRVYADALEGKLARQKEQDPYLFKTCAEEWLKVMRAGAGEEKGLNVAGIGGIADFLYKDDERYILGRQHLLNLTGTVPRPWESNQRYLKRALKPTQLVKGTLVH